MTSPLAVRHRRGTTQPCDPVDPVDAVVVGAGSAGLTVAIGLAGLGRRVALVESGAIGGDCTNTGCIPSKALIHEATNGSGSADGAAALAQTRRRRDELAERESHDVPATPGVELVEGRATVLAGGRVEVVDRDGSSRTITGRHVVIATGARPRPLPIDGLPGEIMLTNETLFEQTAMPGNLVVIGGGAIGVEMACAIRRLGSRVTIVTRGPGVLTGEDPAAAAVLLSALRHQGIAVRTGTVPMCFDARSNELTLADGSTVDGVDRVLIAVGRAPRVEGLELKQLGVEVTHAGIVTDHRGRTGVDGLWAVGDVTTISHTTHGANAYGRRVVQAIAFPYLPVRDRPIVVPTAVFSDPELASVGLVISDIERRWPPAARCRIEIDLATLDRAHTDEVLHGIVVVDAERLTGRVLRATIVGPHASESIGVMTLAVHHRVSLHRLYRLVHPYPTFAAAWGKVADEFARITLPRLPREGAAWGRARMLHTLRRNR